MTLDEIRSATPGIEWAAGQPLKFSGEPTEFKAEGVLVAERAFSAQIQARYHGGYALELEHAYAAPDADDCEQTARAIFTTIEPQTGPMQPPGEMLAGEEAEPIGARSTVKLSQVLSLSQYKPISRAKLKKRQPALRWLRATTRTSSSPWRRSVEFEEESFRESTATFSMDYEREATNGSCRIRLEATRPATPPPPLKLQAAAMATLQTPSISRRHFEVSRLTAGTPLPASGMEVNVNCRVDRDSGRTRDCLGADGAQASSSGTVPMDVAVTRTGARLARAYQFDMAKVPGLDRDDPQPVLVNIPVQVTPADIREVKVGDQAVPFGQAGFRWATRAPASTLEQLYPTRALRMGEETNVILVCQLQEDFSAVCAPTQQDPRPAPDFEWAALEIITYYRAEPKTRDGKPTPGIQFLQNLQFKVQ